jgi:hypothetical protein
MRICVAVVLCAACAGAPRAPASAPKPQVSVASGRCLDRADVEARIATVLAEHHAERSGLYCTVTETDAEPAGVTLQVMRAGGEIGLDRSYTFAPLDCASAPQLLALTVDRWLTSFPEWTEPLPEPAPPERWTEVAIDAAISSMWLPLGADGELGVLVDHGGRANRFGATLVVRASVPQAFGSGRFQQTSFLAAPSWRHRDGLWVVRGELRAGALLVSGVGLTDSRSDWLPWVEAVVFVGRDLGFGVIGGQLAAAPLRDRAVTSDGLVSEDIPLLRVGIAGTFQIR